MSKILIVEDEIIIAFHLETLLKRNNYIVCGKLTNAIKAVEAAKTHSPDLILMDIMLADDTNGLEAGEAIRKFSNSPIIFLSALSDKSTLPRIEKIKNSSLVNKPFKEDNLLETIKEMTGK